MGEVRENQLTKLFFKDAEGSEKELSCTLKNIYKDRIALNTPKEIMNYVDYLQEGDDVSVKIFTPSGVKAYDAIVLNSPLEEDFVVEFVDNYIEIQRRMYLRMAFNTKVLIKKGVTNIVTHTLDIGGGGIRFYYEGVFEPNETVSCNIFFSDMAAIQAQGIVIKEGHLKENEHVMVFTKIEENNRDKIIKKCFELQVNSYQ